MRACTCKLPLKPSFSCGSHSLQRCGPASSCRACQAQLLYDRCCSCCCCCLSLLRYITATRLQALLGFQMLLAQLLQDGHHPC